MIITLPNSKIIIDVSNLSEDAENTATLAIISNMPVLLNQLEIEDYLHVATFIFLARGFEMYSWLYDNLREDYRADFRYLHAAIFRSYIKDTVDLPETLEQKSPSNWLRAIADLFI